MTNFCLPKFAADTFKTKLKSGEINPSKLMKMTSEERRGFFSKFLGEENAKNTNALFESKLLLKNQQQGIITWARTVAKLKPEVMKDVLAKVRNMTEVLQPKDLDSFLADLAEQRLGVGVTVQEAGKIADLAKMVDDKKALLDNGGDRLEYGRAKVAFYNYVNDLKTSVKEKTNVKKVVTEIAGTSKSLNASLDNSAIFRQGWKTMMTHPGTWMNNAKKSFVDLVRTFGGKEVMDEVNADIVSRPTYDKMQKAKLAVGTIEEAFPDTLGTKIVKKVPVLGRVYKASETAYTAFIHRMRADVFDKYLEVAKKSGIDITDTAELTSIGKLVNSLTGRGHLGALEPSADVINNVFFSPRKLKGDIDFLTAHQLQKGVTPFVRKQAAINLVKVVTGTAAILTIANTIKPGSVEWDPRSSDFGKIRIGDTRFDMTAGMSSIITLASRLVKQSTKSSTSKKITKLNSGAFGGQTGTDIVYNFFENKLSPASSVVKDLLKGRDFDGDKVTVQGELKNLLTPLPVSNAIETFKNPKSANLLLVMLADGLGIATNTYSPKKK